MDPLTNISTRRTAQSEQADKRQVPNSAGGWTFTTGNQALLRRFLTLGTTGGTYYVSERKLTKDAAGVVLGMAANDTAALVREVTEISVTGRAPRNTPALFALAAAAGLGGAAGRQAALAALPLVARTGMHLFQFVRYAEQFRGWGRGMVRAVGGWYLSKTPEDAAYQALKYRQREGWTHRDVLRLAHPFRADLHQGGMQAHVELFKWICGKDADLRELPLVQGFVRAQAATTPKEWVAILTEHPAMSHEMLPSEALRSPDVWRALIANPRHLPAEALLRNLGRITRLGVVGPWNDALTTRAVAARLSDQAKLVKARLHPIRILVALRTYALGHGIKGKDTWTPVREITDALDAGFYAAFGAVEPAGKRTMLALDVSGSMGWGKIGDLPITPREVTAAMSMVTMATEPSAIVTGFQTRLTPLNISPRQRLDDVIRAVSSMSFGGTDCAQPMIWALENGVEIDTFTTWTDSETWAGRIHPHQALRQYREKTGIAARMVVIGTTATDFTIADPADPLTLDIAGFDAAMPKLISDFSAGRL